MSKFLATVATAGIFTECDQIAVEECRDQAVVDTPFVRELDAELIDTAKADQWDAILVDAGWVSAGDWIYFDGYWMVEVRAIA